MDYLVSTEFIYDCFRVILFVFMICFVSRGFLRELRELLAWFIYSHWLLLTAIHDRDRYAEVGLTMIDSVMTGDPSWSHVKHDAYLWAVEFIARAEDISKGKVRV